MVIEELGCKTLNSVQLAQNRVHCDLLCLICSHFVSSNKCTRTTVQLEDRHFSLKYYILFDIIEFVCNYQVSCFICLRFVTLARL